MKKLNSVGSRRNSGFSLIELMVAVAIVAILAAVALPSYQQHIRKGKRAAAQAVLMDLANRQQAYLTDKRSYAGTLGALASGFAAPSEISGDFSFAVSADNAATPPAFSATATPTSSTMLADTCGISAAVPLAITQAGTKTPANCWK